jgi:peptidoglycan hydrolase-like protein with peptidoglycan-binding domain
VHKVVKTAKKTSSARTKKSSSTRRKGKSTQRVSRYYQQAPTQERYQEIQRALASKGYFQGEPNGAWGSDSVDALKRFQADQNLMPDGKISSLSLIALGLGPKRLTAKSDATPPLPAARPAGTPAPLSPNPPQ